MIYLAADIKLTLGIDVEESKQNVDSQVRKILKNVSDVPTPLKIRIDEKSFRGDVAELQAILKNIFRSAGIDLSGLIKVGSNKGIGEYTASLKAITGEVENSRQTLLNLSTVLQNTFKSGAPGLSEIQQQISQINPELQRYIQLINTAEARLRGQSQKYYGLGGTDPEMLNRMTVAYKELASARTALANSEVDEDGESPVLKMQDAKGDWVEASSVIQKVIIDVKTYESELRNLNSVLDAEAKAEAQAARARAEAAKSAASSSVIKKDDALRTIRELRTNINQAQAKLVGVGDDIFDAYSPRLRARLGDLTKIEKTANFERLSQSAQKARDLIAELNEALSKLPTGFAKVNPQSRSGSDAIARLQRTITEYRSIEKDYNKTITGTNLKSTGLEELPNEADKLKNVLDKLKDGKISVKELSDEMSRAAINAATYRDELNKIKTSKVSGDYIITSPDAKMTNRLTEKRDEIQKALTDVRAAGGRMQADFGEALEAAASDLDIVSVKLESGALRANEFDAAIEQASMVLAGLDQAQVDASSQWAILEKGTEAYKGARKEAEGLSEALSKLGDRYLSLGHIDTASFSTSDGTLSFDGVRAGLDEFIRKLEAGEITNGQYAQSVADIRSQIETLETSFGEVSTEKKGDKRLAETISDYRSTMNLAAGAQKWTAAKFDPRTAESYKQITVAMQNLKAAYDDFAKNPKAAGAFEKFNAALRDNGEAIDEARANMELYGKNTMSFASRLGEKFKTLFTYSIGARVIYGSAQYMRQLISTATELDTAMGQLRIVTDETESAYVRFGKTASDTAREIGASMKDIIDATTTYARLGYSLDESSILSKYTAMLSKVGDIQTSEAQDAITSMIKAFDIDAKQSDNIETLMDKLVKVGKGIAQGYSNVA